MMWHYAPHRVSWLQRPRASNRVHHVALVVRQSPSYADRRTNAVWAVMKALLVSSSESHPGMPTQWRNVPMILSVARKPVK